MAGLSHHNIATLFDYGTYEGLPYLVMEFVEVSPCRPSCVKPESCLSSGCVPLWRRWRSRSPPPRSRGRPP